MEVTVKNIQTDKHRSQCIIVGVFENRRLSPTAQELDKASQGYISSLLRKGDLEGRLGQYLMLFSLPNVSAERVLLLGCGPEKEFSDLPYRQVLTQMMNVIIQSGLNEVTCSLTELPITDRDLRFKARIAMEVILDALYKFDSYKSNKDTLKTLFKKVLFSAPTKREVNELKQGVLEGEAIAKGVQFIKDLGNTPPNICTPSFLAKEAEKLGKQYSSISTAILSEKEIEALKMGSFLSVAQGSKNPPKLITLEYRGRKDKHKPYVFVGKGITFDTGGNSIKSAAGMIGMKYDMSGGATVLGLLKSAAELELPLNIIGVVPCAENMPGPTATRPEDIVTSMSGQTIEILNTDAEGRLILCDALTYCERFDPEAVIDIATLTGAAVMALGRYPSALMSNYQPLADQLFQAGLRSGDRCWQLPLWEDYQENLASSFADVSNVSAVPEAGAITAGCFLARFTKKFHWAHLDVAGTASRSLGKERGATGRPLPLLMQYLLDRSAK